MQTKAVFAENVKSTCSYSHTQYTKITTENEYKHDMSTRCKNIALPGKVECAENCNSRYSINKTAEQQIKNQRKHYSITKSTDKARKGLFGNFSDLLNLQRYSEINVRICNKPTVSN